MRTLVRAGAVVLWACLVGTAAGTQGLAGIAGAAQPNLASVQTHPSDAQCYIVAGELYCPCSDARASCEPPECILVAGEWYCPEG
jgi:hypothetical protein